MTAYICTQRNKEGKDTDMKIDFNSIEEKITPNFKGGDGAFASKVIEDEDNRIIKGRLTPGSSIGYHIHDTSSEIIFILEGNGKCRIGDEVETLSAGDCHYCRNGESHSLYNDSDSDLVFFAVVPKK